MIRWHFCKDGDFPHVEKPADDNIFTHNMKICLVSYHFRLPDELDRIVHEQEKRERGVFIYQALREGINVWRYNTRFFDPILENIIVDAWISLDEVYEHLWEQEEDTQTQEQEITTSTGVSLNITTVKEILK